MSRENSNYTDILKREFPAIDKELIDYIEGDDITNCKVLYFKMNKNLYLSMKRERERENPSMNHQSDPLPYYLYYLYCLYFAYLSLSI